MKKILLLGSNGYIGYRLYRELSMQEFYSENYDITCVDSWWFDKPSHKCIEADFNSLEKERISKK